jgi:hypothetical protein
MIAQLNYHFQKEKKKLISLKMSLLKEELIYKTLKIHLDHMYTVAKMTTKDFMIENKNNVLKITILRLCMERE